VKLRVVVIENQALIRAGFISLLSSQRDIQVVGEAADGQTGVAQVLSQRPDLTLMDLGMPILDGIQATQQIRQHWPTARILILTNHDQPGYIQQALTAGAGGYVLKDAPYAELLLAIRRVHGGEKYLPSDLRCQVLAAQQHPQLTKGELEVLAVCVEGWSNEEIAQKLNLTEAAVKSHLMRVFNKLGVVNRIQAVAVARRRGYVPLSQES